MRLPSRSNSSRSMSWARRSSKVSASMAGMGVLFFEGARHALQAQGAQLVEGGVGEHRGFSGGVVEGEIVRYGVTASAGKRSRRS